MSHQLQYIWEEINLKVTFVIYLDEELIKHGYNEGDIWFHVDKLSSAHVYLRMEGGMSIESIPEKLLIDCCQLVKANSIEGCKLNNVQIVYTPWANLKKTNGMDTGQVGFVRDKLVKRCVVEKKLNEIVNRLNKTKEEKIIDFAAEKIAKSKAERSQERKFIEEQRQRSYQAEQLRKKEEEMKSYSTVMKKANMKSNKQEVSAEEYEDGFM